MPGGITANPNYPYGGPNYPSNPTGGDPYGLTNPTNNPLNKLYNTGVNVNATDYDTIMNGYKNLMTNFQTRTPTNYNPTTYTPKQLTRPDTYTPDIQTYTPSQDYLNSIGKLKDLSDTGGYSQDNINDIRARGVSPIRSIYANAQSNLDRSRALQGGYSPGYTAATAKMARELSDTIASKVSDVNAQLADSITSNKMKGLEELNNTTQHENDLANEIAQHNVDARNKAKEFNTTNTNDFNKGNADITNNANMFNTQNANDANKFNISTPISVNENNRKSILDALTGMRDLYGTTPALANLFGNQALNAANLQNTITQQNRNAGLNVIGATIRRR